MPNGRRIVLALRVGDRSKGPARTAAWLARELGARVTLLYVATELRTAPEVSVGAALDEGAVRERIREEARARAAALASEVLPPSSYDVRIEEGDVAERVAAVARELKAELVVAGSQGRGRLEGVILGDTTRDILRQAPCPVVVVPPGAAG